jgi:long-subunit fatty acid transport protein
MQKLKIVLGFGLILVLLCPVHIFGQQVPKVGQSGMKWLSIPVGARAVAMGGAYTSVADDISSVFWNPAGSAFTKGGHVFLNQTQWIADIKMNAAALSYNTGQWGVVGVSFMSVDWGVFNGTRRIDSGPGYIETGTFSPSSFAAGLNYGLRLSESFAFGLNFKYVSEKLGSQLEGTWDDPIHYTGKMNLIAFDIGTIYYIGYRDLRIGMSLQNFSNEKQYRTETFPLPLTFKFGAAMNVMAFWMESSQHTLTVATDFMHPRDYTERVHVGLEYGFNDMLYLRGGYKYNYDEESLTFGAGFNFSFLQSLALRLDYSYQEFGNFDGVHMFSFDFAF